MSEDGALSPEADLIIYEGVPFHEWRTDVMRFTIVPEEQVRLTIECCEYLNPTKYNKKHLSELLRFSPIVYLFSECCWARENRLCKERQRKFLDMGYSDVFFLYRHYYGIDKEPNEAGWFRFIEMMRSL
jgi:hypothetical protein